MYLLPSQVVLSSLASVTPVARAILEPPRGERPVCNEECFREWREEVGMAQEKVKEMEEVQEQQKLIKKRNTPVETGYDMTFSLLMELYIDFRKRRRRR